MPEVLYTDDNGQRWCSGPTSSYVEYYGRALVREKLGRLGATWVVGRFDTTKPDDVGNIFVCPDRAYRVLVEVRERALRECGHAEWIRCGYCSQYSPPDEIIQSKSGNNYHAECSRFSAHLRRAKKQRPYGRLYYLAALKYKNERELIESRRPINRERIRKMFREGRRS